MKYLPKRPTGTSPEALFMQWVWDQIIANRIDDSPDILVLRTTRGIKILVKRSTGGGGGLNYRGDYDSTQAYGKDDVVRVRTGASQGVYVCVRSNPVDLNSGTSSPPIYPEPSASGLQNIWEILSLGVVSQSACVGGSNKTIYLNASQPL